MVEQCSGGTCGNAGSSRSWPTTASACTSGTERRGATPPSGRDFRRSARVSTRPPEPGDEGEVGQRQDHERPPQYVRAGMGHHERAGRRRKRLRDQPRPRQSADDQRVALGTEQREGHRTARDRVDAVAGAVEHQRRPRHRQARRQQQQPEGDQREGGGQRPERVMPAPAGISIDAARRPAPGRSGRRSATADARATPRACSRVSRCTDTSAMIVPPSTSTPGHQKEGPALPRDSGPAVACWRSAAIGTAGRRRGISSEHQRQRHRQVQAGIGEAGRRASRHARPGTPRAASTRCWRTRPTSVSVVIAGRASAPYRRPRVAKAGSYRPQPMPRPSSSQPAR